MILANQAVKVRREKIVGATEGILRQIEEPISTSELVKRVTKFLNAKDGTAYVARELQKAWPQGHPQRRPTGVMFEKYGRQMPRYEWVPLENRPVHKPDPRRAAIEALEAEDPSADGLEDLLGDEDGEFLDD